MFTDFISSQEEAALLTLLDHEQPPWKERSFNGLARYVVGWAVCVARPCTATPLRQPPQPNNPISLCLMTQGQGVGCGHHPRGADREPAAGAAAAPAAADYDAHVGASHVGTVVPQRGQCH